LTAESYQETGPLNVDLPNQFAERLQQPLPGWRAHTRFQPELSFGRHQGPAPRDARPAAVLVLLMPRQAQWHVPLILRPAHMLDHASQISLPGGVIEPGESSHEAALRECDEELGGQVSGIKLLGRLTEVYLFASGFRVIPWVGAVDFPPTWTPNPGEVERVLEVPLSHFANPASFGSLQRRMGDVVFHAPCFHWQRERIWGATSMILAELMATLEGLRIE
jgi:8-oxo-dGTP pyrophosphatase MutT (NUDIX family)